MNDEYCRYDESYLWCWKHVTSRSHLTTSRAAAYSTGNHGDTMTSDVNSPDASRDADDEVAAMRGWCEV